jgi:simple sugar transport system substrate-binding protein
MGYPTISNAYKTSSKQSFHDEGSMMKSIFNSSRVTGWRSWAILFVLLAIGAISILLTMANTPAPVQPTPTPDGDTVQPRPRVVMIVHGNFSTSKFWPKVQRGAERGAEDYGIELELHGLVTPVDMVEMSGLIEQAVASHPDGMIISLPDKDALTPAVEKIVAAGIPFIVINAGRQYVDEVGALTYIGQLEYEAGHQAGMRLAAEGVRHAYCINHEPQNVAVMDRCRGFIDAITLAGGNAETLVVDQDDVENTKARIADVLKLFPDVDGFLTTKDMPALLEVVEAMGMEDKVKIGEFDFSPGLLEAILEGKVLFAIDQQPYLQGYLPMTFFNLRFTNANTISQNEIATGPSFITKENAELIMDLSEAGTR